MDGCASDFDVLMPGIADIIKECVDRATAPLLDRIASLEARGEPVVVEKAVQTRPDLAEWRPEFDAFLAEGHAALVEQKTANAELRARLPSPDELRKAVEAVGFESRAAIGDLKGQVADLAIHLRERADADTARVAAELDRRVPDIARRASDLVPPLDVAGAVSDALMTKAEMFAKMTAPLVSVPDAPTLPDIPAAVSDELTRREGAIVDRAVAVARGEIEKSAADLRTKFADAILDAEKIKPLARAEIDEALAMRPASITLDDIYPLIERAASPLRKAIDALPAGPNAAEVERIAGEIKGLVESTTSDQLRAPDDLVRLIEMVGGLLSQPFAVSMDIPAQATVLPRKKTIRTWRDEAGNLSAEVIEETEG